MDSDLPNRSRTAALNLLLQAEAQPRTMPAQALSGKRVLVTGAGGSIGSALARSVQASNPASLVLLDSSEHGLYQVDRALRQKGIPVLGSICDKNLLSYLFETYRPQIVFHAAACKQVPLMEQNAFAAITNNALGTLVLTETAAAFRAERLILVSTDKAVDPHSIMGASKRIAELVVLSFGTESQTRFSAVRLGNVAGTQGSVLPLFLEQIANGGPITVTHPDTQRFFMTLQDSVESLLAALDHLGSPALLAPDLGSPFRILDLAQHLIKAHASNAAVQFTGLHPGEKLVESLLAQNERWLPGNASLRVIESPVPSPSVIRASVHELTEATRTHDLARLLRTVLTLVPNYQPSALLAPALEAALA